MTDWKPIETAPKDGTEILVCGFASRGYYVTTAKWHGEWMLFNADDDAHTVESFDHTHWMPLPSPPKEEER